MKKRVLVVDDSPLVRDLCRAQLQDAGYEALLAEDGIAAINAAFQEAPDLILLDVQMPKINGYQVCRLLKDHPRTKDIPIVIMTAKAARGIVQDPRQWSFQTGADGYYGKDEGLDLLAEVRMFLEAGGGRPAPARPPAGPPMGETEIMLALSQLLDRQLYLDVTRLKELDEKKDAFVANVSHELRSPLTILKGFLATMKDGSLGATSADQQEALTIMLGSVDRLSRLINDILDLSQIAAGKLKLRLEDVDLGAVLEEVAESFALEARRKKIRLTLDLPAPPVRVRGDRDRLTQVVVNLAGNALKYTPEGEGVAVRLRVRQAQAEVEVRDTGPGIREEARLRIFDKFERILAEKAEGTGLGLSIAKDIVDLHGGRIWVEPPAGRGSRFVFALPLLETGGAAGGARG